MDKKNDVPKGHLLAGTKIKYMHTLSSWHDSGMYISVMFNLNGQEVLGRITTGTIMKMVNEFGFTMRKKRKYIHLEDPLLVLDSDSPEIHSLYGFV